jgi:hypothetical protein
MFVAIAIAALAAWSALAASHVSAVEMHLLLVVAAAAYLFHLSRSRDRDDRSLGPVRVRSALQDARTARKRRRHHSVADLGAAGRDGHDAPDGETAAATRAAILELLSCEEVASLTAPHPAHWLNADEEFLDLEHVDRGIRRASAVAAPAGHLLPRTAVSDETWRQIVSRLNR